MPIERTIVLGTTNKGKIAELRALLQASGITVKGLADFPDLGDIAETGTTFAENARLKAAAVAAATGLPAVADDSGLCVDALGGAPGVFSARYGGENATDAINNAKLLDALRDVPPEKRAARFVCAMAATTPDGRWAETQAAWEGVIALSPQGDGGFGYDPLFFDPALGRAAAQLTPEEKNARSHRGKALARLIPLLDELLT
ncbi:XTP/dITP diphosphatase [Desulfovibrio sulfodismutans]|uniref:dITP/XTP pyrophosphatase n=1 Tax=Desulfolutivibrio sulfodismutans TaxID=63561 RepID=A0A7K3NLJ5_9BACT|nr:XTP/dITP diphosphatase [Desulfolutivibrio sulfodismutans]NDY57052.1 XTP/dITP diphosphatase [Desulfolutivibrio sulfodismutans]QLA12483.1 XTP/dITP diphosphatase [Desulfolutivibrio sulfodismutans DSM 3696]